MGTWEHMAVGIPMTLSVGIAGLTYAGSDVGGFFGNPDVEMLVRWYQVGAFAPFFRAHAHIDTKRREPYLYDDPYKSIMRDILRLRYSLLPVWYTAFHEASVRGIPVLRPQYVVFPKDPRGFALDQQYYLGASGLLVKPVTTQGATETEVYLSDDQVYYDYFDSQIYRGGSKSVTVPAPLEKVPLLVRGGSIIPTRARPRRSSPLMKKDPFTLKIALDKTGFAARGELYLDDGETYAHQQGELIWREFIASKAERKKVLDIRSVDLVSRAGGEGAVDGVTLSVYDRENAFARDIAGVTVERIIVLGLESRPKSVKLENGKELQWTFNEGTSAKGKKSGAASLLTIKTRDVYIVEDWSIAVEL